jgi:hypothetical protein
MAALRDSLAAGRGEHLFLLLAIADHLFLTFLPRDHPQPTEAVLRARTFLQERFGEKFEDQIIEFFVIGGGYARVAGDVVILSGAHPVFDPVFAEPGRPETDRLIAEFVRAKFELSLATLRAEAPDWKLAAQV